VPTAPPAAANAPSSSSTSSRRSSSRTTVAAASEKGIECHLIANHIFPSSEHRSLSELADQSIGHRIFFINMVGWVQSVSFVDFIQYLSPRL